MKDICYYRSELTKHPLDIRGSRRSLEAARIFLKMESRQAKQEEKVEFLDTTILKNKNTKDPEKGENKDRIVCPTVACDWLAAKTLGCFRNGFPFFWVKKYPAGTKYRRKANVKI